MILICNVLFFLSKIVFWKADSFSLFLAERLMLSVVTAGLSGCDSAYLYLLAGKENSRKAFGIYKALSAAGILTASLVFSLLPTGSYGLYAQLTVFSYGLAMLLSFFLPEEKPESMPRGPFWKQMRQYAASARKDRKFLLFLTAVALLDQTEQTVTVFLNQLQYLRAGIPIRAMGGLYLLVSAAELFSAFSARLSRKLGDMKTAVILFAAAGLSCTGMALTSNPVLSVLGIVFLHACSALFYPVGLEIQNRRIAKEEARATILSVNAMGMDLVGAAASLTLGKAADSGVAGAMALGGLFCFAGLLLIIISKRSFTF